MQARDVQLREFELSIGEVIQVGDNLITLVDIENEDVCLHVDSGETDSGLVPSGRQHALPPR